MAPPLKLTPSSQSEEREGLLSDVDTLSFIEADESKYSSSSDTITLLSIGLAALPRIAVVVGTLLGLVFGLLYWLPAPQSSIRTLHFNGDTLRSNGTHDFKRTVLLVADYLDRGLTPHLLDISKKGLRAKFMKPVFPTLTFPNHWALMTGLYAESHGIVANNFWDAETDSEFHYNNITSCWQPHWWRGEPMWETAGRAGLITANLMWPGPPETFSGASPTYFVPWADKVSLDVKLAQIMDWIDLPLSKRPQLILAYEPSLDQAGHATGPYSQRVNDTLKYVDAFARDLHSSLVARNLSDIVDVVFVSDHGMTDTSHPELLYIDDILGEEGWQAVEHEDGWPSMGLHFNPSANTSHYLDVLLAAAADNKEKFNVYTPQTMPERYHFGHSARIAPIYVIPNMGYVLTTRKEGDNHGYDNNEPSMHAIFVAHGPFSTVAKAIHHSQSTSHRPRWLSNPDKGWHSTSDATYVMNGFQNVEIYNLVMKLLGIEAQATKTNGTTGFWDKYL
ncbi:Phosphodiest-domain-containing protein [Russula ochroleuca]|uniref:Phosphodiest-domain-containing protein n=1 Tax=Russula ochroleuca TaxID=152965 RepID=A0A9P5MS89_9AGAM|nr:Phosphodiest-domain-containing protein [Russula ochroleuca]